MRSQVRDSQTILLGITAVAAELRVSIVRARQLIDRGDLPCLYDSSGKRLVMLPDLRAFKKERETKARAAKRGWRV